MTLLETKESDIRSWDIAPSHVDPPVASVRRIDGVYIVHKDAIK